MQKIFFFVFAILTGCVKKTADFPEPASRPPLFSDCDDESSVFCDEDLDDLPENNESDIPEKKELEGENLQSSTR